MTVRLDQIVELGALRVGVVSRSAVWSTRLGSSMLIGGGKEPVAILMLVHSSMIAFSPAGAVLSEAEVARLCPGAWAALTSDG
jgi:hypothetical protein